VSDKTVKMIMPSEYSPNTVESITAKTSSSKGFCIVIKATGNLLTMAFEF
jgi:hypothetical protein